MKNILKQENERWKDTNLPLFQKLISLFSSLMNHLKQVQLISLSMIINNICSPKVHVTHIFLPFTG